MAICFPTGAAGLRGPSAGSFAQQGVDGRGRFSIRGARRFFAFDERSGTAPQERGARV
jgi:hypothetical protein